MSEQQQANFEGWAILEIFGHQRYAGYVSTQAFGSSVMFRLDVPELEARERTAKRPAYIDGEYAPAGSLIKEGPVQGYTKLFGVSAIYAMTPCSKEAALKAVEEIQPRPLMEVQIPTEANRQLQTGASGPVPTLQTEDDKIYGSETEDEEDEEDEEEQEEERYA